MKASKQPAWWWRDCDSRALLRALHALGWHGRKGEKRAEIVNAVLTDRR